MSMTHREFYEIVKAMRTAQKNYFRTRLDCYLKESKVLERQIDAEIERVEKVLNPKPIQQKLF